MYVYTSPVAADIEKSWPREVTLMRQLSVVSLTFAEPRLWGGLPRKDEGYSYKDSVLEIQQMRLA